MDNCSKILKILFSPNNVSNGSGITDLNRVDGAPPLLLVLKDVRDKKILHTEFLKVQYIQNIQAILGRKLMKKLTFIDEKIFRVF